MWPAAPTARLGKRLALALTGALVVIVAVAPAAALGATNVTVGESQNDIVVRFGGFGDVRVGNGLSFSDSLSLGDPAPGAGARASQDSTLTDSPGGLSLASTASVSASGGTVDQGTSGEAHMGHELTVLTPVAFRVSGSVASGSLTSSSVMLRLVPNFEGATGFEFDAQDGGGPRSAQGTLVPGSWQLSFLAVTSSPCLGSCTASWDITLELDEPAPAVAIGAGPSGLVSSRNARFEFTTTDSSPPPGGFECRLDGAGSAGFTPCTSPHDVSGLADGPHVFDVRYHPTGDDPSPPTRRSWTVDTTPPAVVFDAAPSGTANGSNAQIEFHSTEPDGATFRCKLDAGPEVDCSSPHLLVGLSAGAHSLAVTATDKAGNVSAPATTAWTVGSTAAPVVSCDPGRASAGFGPVRVIAVQAGACFVDETVDGRPAQVSRGQVMLNGITLTPAAGTRIIVSSRLGDGTVRTDGPVTIVFGRPPAPGEDPIDLTLPSLDLSSLGTSTSGVNKTLSFAEGLLQVAGLKAAPGLGLELAADNGGQMKVTFRVTLPTIAFKRLPGSPEGVTVEFSPTFSNDRGVTLGGRIKLGSVYLFGRKIKDLDLAYDHSTGLFDGSFGIALGEAVAGRAEPTFTASITIGPDTSPCQLRKVGLQQSNLNRHLGRGVFLQRYGGTFQCVSEGGGVLLKLAGNGGVSAGPRIAIGSFETEAISIDGTATLALPITGGDFSFEIEGVGKVVDFPVSSQKITYKPPATVGLTGTLDITIGGYGGVFTYGQSFVSPTAFNIEATGTAQIGGFVTGAEAVFSSTGFAVCAGPPGLRVGFGRRWGGTLAGFSGVCDVGPFRTAQPARAAQGGPRSFVIARDRPLTVIAAKGSGAPPKIAVAAPGGVRFETPMGSQALSTKDVLIVQDREADTTFVVLRRPAAGRWTIATVGGSAAPASIRFARGLPRLRLTTRVSGSGARRVLTWRASGLDGQRLQFLERSGRAARLLTTTRRSSGRFSFTPDPALGVRRTIQALVFNGATPRSKAVVARFRVTAPRRPVRVSGLKLRKGILTWRAQGGVARYELALTRPDGTQTSHEVRRARLSLKGLPKKGTLRIAIIGVNPAGRAGPVASTRLRLG